MILIIQYDRAYRFVDAPNRDVLGAKRKGQPEQVDSLERLKPIYWLISYFETADTFSPAMLNTGFAKS